MFNFMMRRTISSPLTKIFALPIVFFTYFSPLSYANATDIVIDFPNLKDCFYCHGDDGIGRQPGVPNISHQDEPYLIRQLQSFSVIHGHLDRRESLSMNSWSQGLTKTEMKAMAHYFATLPCPTTHAGGETPKVPNIWQKRCTQCHSDTKHRDQFYAPNIMGQNTAYLEKQLRSFRKKSVSVNDTSLGNNALEQEHGRKYHAIYTNSEHMTDEEIVLLADYLSRAQCE